MNNLDRFRGHTIDNRYTILNQEPLGFGKDTVVYQGVTRKNRASAIKFFDPTKHEAANIRREAQTQAELHHPNILPFEWSGIARITPATTTRLIDDEPIPQPEHYPYIAMQFANRGSLELAMRQGTPLDIDQIMKYAVDIVAGLEYAHGQGETHRDIKPANLLIHDDTVKIADWGIAVPARTGVSDFTRQFPRGTSKYMAPEQADGLATIHSDLYATGVVLWEAIAGQHPFEATSDIGYLLAHQRDDIPLLETVLGDKMTPTIAAVEKVLRTVLIKDQKIRRLHFGSAAAFGDELQHEYDKASGKKAKTDIDLAARDAAAARLDARLMTLYATKAAVVEEITAKQTHIRTADEDAAERIATQQRLAEEHAAQLVKESERKINDKETTILATAETQADQMLLDAEATIDTKVAEADAHVEGAEARVAELGAQKDRLTGEVAELEKRVEGLTIAESLLAAPVEEKAEPTTIVTVKDVAPSGDPALDAERANPIEKAKEILGENFLGVEAIRAMEVKLKHAGHDVHFVLDPFPPFPYTEQEIEAAKDKNQILVLRASHMIPHGTDKIEPITLDNLYQEFLFPYDLELRTSALHDETIPWSPLKLREIETTYSTSLYRIVYPSQTKGKPDIWEPGQYGHIKKRFRNAKNRNTSFKKTQTDILKIFRSAIEKPNTINLGWELVDIDRSNDRSYKFQPTSPTQQLWDTFLYEVTTGKRIAFLPSTWLSGPHSKRIATTLGTKDVTNYRRDWHMS